MSCEPHEEAAWGVERTADAQVEQYERFMGRGKKPKAAAERDLFPINLTSQPVMPYTRTPVDDAELRRSLRRLSPTERWILNALMRMPPRDDIWISAGSLEYEFVGRREPTAREQRRIDRAFTRLGERGLLDFWRYRDGTLKGVRLTVSQESLEVALAELDARSKRRSTAAE